MAKNKGIKEELEIHNHFTETVGIKFVICLFSCILICICNLICNLEVEVATGQGQGMKIRANWLSYGLLSGY